MYWNYGCHNIKKIEYRTEIFSSVVSLQVPIDLYRTIWAHIWYDMGMKKYDKSSYPQQEHSDQQKSAVRITHSYLMKWSSEKWKNEVWQKWAHLFLCKSNIYKSIGTLSFWKLRVSHKVLNHVNRHENMRPTMHNENFPLPSQMSNIYKYKKPGLDVD